MALNEGKNTDYTIVKIEKANHLFQITPGRIKNLITSRL